MLLSHDDTDRLRWARLLSFRGATVTLVLLDDAAAMARRTHPAAGALDLLADAGVEMHVDDGAMRRRGLSPGDLHGAVKPSDIAAIGDLIIDATDKVIWR